MPATETETAVIRGVIVAEVGNFKSGRGRFDSESLKRIVQLMRANEGGTICRYTHSDGGHEDTLGTLLGRIKNPRLVGDKVRGDLHLDPVAFISPRGDLGSYLIELAKSAPESFGMSLVLNAEEVWSGTGTLPLWLPTEITGCDVVGCGDATSSLLSRPLHRQRDVWRLAQQALNRSRKRLASRGYIPGEYTDLFRRAFAGMTARRIREFLLRYRACKFGQSQRVQVPAWMVDAWRAFNYALPCTRPVQWRLIERFARQFAEREAQ